MSSADATTPYSRCQKELGVEPESDHEDLDIGSNSPLSDLFMK